MGRPSLDLGTLGVKATLMVFSVVFVGSGESTPFESKWGSLQVYPRAWRKREANRLLVCVETDEQWQS